MIEEVLINDMESRGLFVTRNARFSSCAQVVGTSQLEITYEDMSTNTMKTIRAEYLVGCDGARSKVRTSIPDAELEGEVTNASWGVLDGKIRKPTMIDWTWANFEGIQALLKQTSPIYGAKWQFDHTPVALFCGFPESGI